MRIYKHYTRGIYEVYEDGIYKGMESVKADDLKPLHHANLGGTIHQYLSKHYDSGHRIFSNFGQSYFFTDTAN